MSEKGQGDSVAEEIGNRVKEPGERPQDLFWPNRERTDLIYDAYDRVLPVRRNQCGCLMIELGCGYGWYLERMLRNRLHGSPVEPPVEYVGFDLHEACVEKCRQKFSWASAYSFHQADLKTPEGIGAVCDQLQKWGGATGSIGADVIAPGVPMFFEPEEFGRLIRTCLGAGAKTFTCDILPTPYYKGRLKGVSLDTMIGAIEAQFPPSVKPRIESLLLPTDELAVIRVTRSSLD